MAPQLIYGTTEGPSGGLGPVSPPSDLPSFIGDDARGLGRLFLRSGIGG